MLASRSEEVLMRERLKRLLLATSLTVLDIALAEKSAGVIWRAWSGVLWIREGILLFLGVWVASAAVLWAPNEGSLSMGPSSTAGELGRDGDV
jgi:hypothetical protein